MVSGISQEFWFVNWHVRTILRFDEQRSHGPRETEDFQGMSVIGLSIYFPGD